MFCKHIGGEIMAYSTKNTKVSSKKSSRSECGRDGSKSNKKSTRTSSTKNCD